LPEQVQVMVSLINANNIESYKLSPELHKDEEIWRRVIESAWPIKMEESSSYIFITSDEKPSYQNCVIVDQKEDIRLVNCS